MYRFECYRCKRFFDQLLLASADPRYCIDCKKILIAAAQRKTEGYTRPSDDYVCFGSASHSESKRWQEDSHKAKWGREND